MKSLLKKSNLFKNNRNPLTLILIVIILFMFVSCSEDDDENVTSEIYRLTSITTVNPYDLNNDGNATRNLISETSCTSFDQTLTFNSNNTGTFSTKTFLLVYEGSLPGTFQSDCFQVDEIIENITWSQTQNTRTYTQNGGTFTGFISGSQLVFNFIDGLPILDNPQDNNIIATEDVEVIYELQ